MREAPKATEKILPWQFPHHTETKSSSIIEALFSSNELFSTEVIVEFDFSSYPELGDLKPHLSVCQIIKKSFLIPETIYLVARTDLLFF